MGQLWFSAPGPVPDRVRLHHLGHGLQSHACAGRLPADSRRCFLSFYVFVLYRSYLVEVLLAAGGAACYVKCYVYWGCSGGFYVDFSLRVVDYVYVTGFGFRALSAYLAGYGYHLGFVYGLSLSKFLQYPRGRGDGVRLFCHPRRCPAERALHQRSLSGPLVGHCQASGLGHAT